MSQYTPRADAINLWLFRILLGGVYAFIAYIILGGPL